MKFSYRLFSISVFVLMCFAIAAPQVSAGTIPEITVAETVASVSEVKATRTLTVGAVPVLTETITIGLCVISFTPSTQDTDCSNNNGSIATTTDTTASAIASRLRTFTGVSATGHGALTITGATTNVIYTTTGTEASATAINFTDGTTGDITSTNSVTGVIPVAQTVTFTPTALAAAIYTAILNGVSYSFDTTAATPTAQTVVEGLQPLLAADGATTCTENNVAVTCVADTAGTTFTYSWAVSGYQTTSGGGSGGGGGSSSSKKSKTTDAKSTTTDSSSSSNSANAIAAEEKARLNALLATKEASGAGLDLDMGAMGEEVKALQELLIAKGYSIPAGATGYFGSQTKAALAAFQAANGITPSAGYFGPKTRASLK